MILQEELQEDNAAVPLASRRRERLRKAVLDNDDGKETSSDEQRSRARWNPLRRLEFSYFALFRPLRDTQSRCILFAGVVLAIAAGAPLPIIGVIFSKIINSFPPSETEIHERVVQLIGVGMWIFFCRHPWQ